MTNNININVTTNADNAGKKFKSLGSSIISSMQQADAMKRAFDFLDRAVNSGKISLQRYGQIVDQLDKEETQLYTALGKTTTAIQRQGVAAASTAKNMSRAAETAQEFSRRQRMAGKSTNRFGMVSQQVGYQVGDFFVQVQSGTNALVAFGQQGTQLAGLLPGLSGAILGIGLSLGTALLGSQLKARNLEIDFKKLGSAFKEAMAPIEPLLSAIGSALSTMGTAANSALGLISDNLARVITYGITAATIFGVKMVRAFALAAIASGKFTEILRAGLIRTGIGALVVLAGEIVYQFTRIVKASGGVGNALSLLGQIAKEVFFALPSLMKYVVYQWSKYVTDMVTSWTVSLKKMVEQTPKFVNKIIGAFKGSIAAVKEIWMYLPDIFVEVFRLTAEKIKEGVVAWVDIILTGFNYARKLIGEDPITAKDLFDEDTSGGSSPADAIVASLEKAKKAFSSAMGEDYISMGVGFLDNVIKDLEAQSTRLGKSASDAFSEFKNANPTLEKLIKSLKKLEDAGFDVSDIFTSADDEDLLGGSNKSGPAGPKLMEAPAREFLKQGDMPFVSTFAFEKQLELERELLGVSEDRARVLRQFGLDFAQRNPEIIAGLEEQIRATREISQIGNVVQKSFEDGFMAIAEGSKSVVGAFKDMARLIIKELFKVLVVQRAVGSFASGGQAGSGILGFLGDLVGKKASGGTMMPNKPYLVGERGPELVMPNRQGSIYNADLTGKALGGSGKITQVFNFNLSANGDESVKKIVAQAAPQIADMAQKGVIAARRRGGTMRSTFG